MYCPKCGTKIEGIAKFCPKCGNNLADYCTDENSSKKGSRKISRVTKETGTDPYIVKPKKKKEKQTGSLKSLLVVAIVAVAVLGVFACTKIIGNIFSNSEYYVVLSDDKYQITRNPKRGANIELAPANIDNSNDAYVRFSPDKKYVYFYTKVNDKDCGSLCRAEIGKLKKNSSKNDKYIETIDTKVQVGFKFFKDGSMVYKKTGGILYYYDGTESVLLDKNVGDVETDHESRLVYCVEQEDDYNTPYRFDIYGIDKNDIDNKIKIASDAYEIRKIDDFDNIIFEKCDDEYTKSLFSAGFNKGSVKIADNATYIDSYGGIVIYTEETGKVNLLDYLVDDAPDDDYYYDLIREEIREEEPPELFTIYKYADGESTVIEEDVVAVGASGKGILCYTTENMIDGKVFIDEYDELWELFRCDYSKATYVLTRDPENKLKLSAKATDDLLEPDEANWPAFYCVNQNIYIFTKNELWAATVKEGEITDTVAIADEAYSVGYDESSLYYISGQYNSNYGDVCRISDGDATRVAQDIMAFDFTLYEDGSIIGYTDISSYADQFCGDISLFDSNGEKHSVGTDVTDFIRKDPTEILFISEGNLYSFDGKEKEQLQNNVDRVWCSDSMKKSDAVSF